MTISVDASHEVAIGYWNHALQDESGAPVRRGEKKKQINIEHYIFGDGAVN